MTRKQTRRRYSKEFKEKPRGSARELKRHLSITYRAAWRGKYKLPQAMAQTEGRRQVFDRAAIDDDCFGGDHPSVRAVGYRTRRRLSLAYHRRIISYTKWRSSARILPRTALATGPSKHCMPLPSLVGQLVSVRELANEIANLPPMISDPEKRGR